jgi:hypothetical protein
MLGIKKSLKKVFKVLAYVKTILLSLRKIISNMNTTALILRDEATVSISTLKKGEYFRRVGGKKIYMYEGKCRVYDKWGSYKGWGFEFTPVDDYGGGSMSTKTNIPVEVGFDY